MCKYFCDRCGNELMRNEEGGYLIRNDITGEGEHTIRRFTVQAVVVGSKVNHLCHKCMFEILNRGIPGVGKYE